MASSSDQPSTESDVSAVIHRDLAKLIACEPVPVQTVDFKRKDAMIFEPKTKSNTGYFVLAILFNKQNQVLLVQDAKGNHKDSWYLPSARLEPNETLVQGTKRAVAAGTGLTCDITTLLSFHFGGVRLMRFTFCGEITGGKLKTLAEKDEESLQADFYDAKTVFHWKVNLRNGDIIPAIHLAIQYKDSLASDPIHPVLRPVTVGHSLLLHRFLLVADNDQKSSLMILAGCEGGPHVVTCAIAPGDPSLLLTVHALIRTAISGETFCPTIQGVVSVEHNGREKGKEGMCITTLVNLAVPRGKDLPSLRNDDFRWVPVTEEACVRFMKDGMEARLCKFLEK